MFCFSPSLSKLYSVLQTEGLTSESFNSVGLYVIFFTYVGMNVLAIHWPGYTEESLSKDQSLNQSVSCHAWRPVSVNGPPSRCIIIICRPHVLCVTDERWNEQQNHWICCGCCLPRQKNKLVSHVQLHDSIVPNGDDTFERSCPRRHPWMLFLFQISICQVNY